MMSKELYNLCKKNDRASHKKVYEMLYGKLFAISRRYVRDYEEASDVLNNAFLKIFRNYHQCQKQDSFVKWASRVVVNTALDHLRSVRRYKEHIQFEEDFEEKYDLEADTSSLLEYDIEELYIMINELPPATKAVFNMYALDGYSHKEVSEKLNISEVSSRWHVNRARKLLRKKLEKKKLMVEDDK